MALEQYDDLLANVRHDGEFHSIRALVQPYDPEVQAIAHILHQKPDFIAACQDYVNGFVTYTKELGDYWQTPSETLAREYGDCDDKAILLTSLLRNYYPPDEVYCAFGYWRGGGHMWVVLGGADGEDMIIEATAPSSAPLKGTYNLLAIFNDRLAFATQQGIKDFVLIPISLQEEAYATA